MEKLKQVNLGLRFVIEVLMLSGIVIASVANYKGSTELIAAVVGLVVAIALWGVFAVPGDPSRSGKTVIATPGSVRRVIELGLFVSVTVWLAVAEVDVMAAVLGAGTFIHYAAWPDRIRWLLQH